MRKVRSTVAAMTVLLIAQVGMGNPVETPGRLDQVTVYRGQALVTRVVEVPGPSGLREVVVTDLPDRVVPESIYAESDDAIAVRAVRFRVRPVAHDVRDEVRALDEDLLLKRDELDALERRRTLIGQHQAYLDQLDNFTAPTASKELTEGVLDADVLKTLTLFLFEQRNELSEQELKIDRRTRSLNEEIRLLQRERDQLTGGPARTVREAVVFVEINGNDGGTLRVRYLVDNATWSPSYNVRASDGSNITLEYNATIHQRSGEDWSDVAMTLSTATPTLISKAPPLSPLTVNLSREPSQQTKARQGNYTQLQNDLQARKNELELNRNSANILLPQGETPGVQILGIDAWVNVDNRGNDMALNTAAAELQMFELLTARRAGKQSKKPATMEGICVSYKLPGRTTLPSRSDRQSIQIVSLDLPAETFKVATPVLTGFVYDEAEVTNSSNTVLLAGPVAAYVDGAFVGHDDLPMVTAGERFSVGLGIDTSLRATRELMNRRERTQGGNRLVTFTYRLTVENFGASDLDVRILDRLPRSKRSQVKVTLAENAHKLSDDRRYLQGPRDDGILRWDTNVPQRATGPDAFTLDYEFVLEYDKAMHITGLAMAE